MIWYDMIWYAILYCMLLHDSMLRDRRLAYYLSIRYTIGTLNRAASLGWDRSPSETEAAFAQLPDGIGPDSRWCFDQTGSIRMEEHIECFVCLVNGTDPSGKAAWLVSPSPKGDPKRRMRINILYIYIYICLSGVSVTFKVNGKWCHGRILPLPTPPLWGDGDCFSQTGPMQSAKKKNECFRMRFSINKTNDNNS